MHKPRHVFKRNVVQTYESELDSDEMISLTTKHRSPDEIDSAKNKTSHNEKSHAESDEVMASTTKHLSSDEIPNSPGQPSCSQRRFKRRKIVRREAQNSSQTAKNKGIHNAKSHATSNEVMSSGTNDIKLIRTVKGKLKLCHNGFSYHLNKTTEEAKYWDCEFRRTPGLAGPCGSRAITRKSDKRIEIMVKKEHNHEPSSLRIASSDYRSKITQRAMETTDKPGKIIRQVSVAVSPEVGKHFIWTFFDKFLGSSTASNHSSPCVNIPHFHPLNCARGILITFFAFSNSIFNYYTQYVKF
ncbi:uncharacterized protein LOC135716244 [Ochlerotatus camptorhynchus]|uniref:uncharacterized protein LOC135716244 n=1 Tax=Ochlerotatus camptorhynchus TaxID=644619 RepID=UPI0031DBD12F